MAKKRHPLRTAFLILLLLFLLFVALPYGYLRFVGFSYDDPAALMANHDTPFDLVSLSDSGLLALQWDKADLYCLLEESGLKEQALALLEPWRSRLRLEPEAVGFTLSETRLTVSLKLSLLRFLPLQLQLVAALQPEGAQLRVTPKSISIGRWISLSVERLAELAQHPELAGPQLLGPAAAELPLESLTTGTDCVRCTVRLPAALFSALDLSASTMSELLYCFHPKALPSAAEAGRSTGFLPYFQAAITERTARAALAAYLGLVDSRIADRLLPAAAPYLALLGVEETAIQSAQAAYLAQLAQGQRNCEALLAALRERYQEGSLTLCPEGFLYQGSALSLSAMGSELGLSGLPLQQSRPVLLYSRHSDRPVQTADMPHIDSLPRSGDDALPPGGQSIYDLGIALRLPSGLPVLIYGLAGGELVVQELWENTFTALLEAERLPTLCSDEIPTLPVWQSMEAPAADLRTVFYLLFPKINPGSLPQGSR